MKHTGNPVTHTARRTIGGTTYIVNAYFKQDTAETAASTMARVIDLALQAAPRSFCPIFPPDPFTAPSIRSIMRSHKLPLRMDCRKRGNDAKGSSKQDRAVLPPFGGR